MELTLTIFSDADCGIRLKNHHITVSSGECCVEFLSILNIIVINNIH